MVGCIWSLFGRERFSRAERGTSLDRHGTQEGRESGLLEGAVAAESYTQGFPQVGISSHLTRVVTEVGRCINKDDKHPEGQSCSLPLRSLGLGSRVSLQMNLFLFCAMCARPIKISSSASRVGKGRCKKRKRKRKTSLLSPPSQPITAPLTALLLFFSCRGLANSPRLSRAHARTHTHNSCPALHPF